MKDKLVIKFNPVDRIHPLFSYWKAQHAQREIRRCDALAKGLDAKYGYYRDRLSKPPQIEPTLDDTPPTEYLSDYRLEITYKQANELVLDGAETINMIVKDKGKWHLTYKNALKLPNNKIIKDINGHICLFRNKRFIKILYI